MATFRTIHTAAGLALMAQAEATQAQAADAATTAIGLSLGAAEANPLGVKAVAHKPSANVRALMQRSRKRYNHEQSAERH